MIFELTEQQRKLQSDLRQLLEKEIMPRAEEIDRTGAYPREGLKILSDFGVTGMTIPKEYGGNKKDYVTVCLVGEEIARACLSTSCVINIYHLGSFPFLIAGSEAQRQCYLPDIAAGKRAGSFCLTELESGSDAASIKATAVLKGDKYLINGHKIFIGNTGESDIYVVFAKTDATKGARGISAFIVEKGTPGFRIGEIYLKMGINGQRTGELFFENCEVPKENLLGVEGEGLKIALKTLNIARVTVAAQALGVAQAAMEESLQYALKRQQFGKPIFENQGIQFKIANMATQIHAARLMTLDAAARLDEGMIPIKECSMAKYCATETANRVAYDAVEIFGGRGYLKGFKVERFFRDARVLTLYEGTSEIQQIIISREMAKEQF